MLKSFVINLNFLHLTRVSLWSFLINTFLDFLIFLSINGSFDLFNMIIYLGFLFVISVSREWKSVIKSRYLRSRCKNLFFFKPWAIVLIFWWWGFLYFICVFLIKYFRISADLLWFSLTLCTEIIWIMMLIMLSCTTTKVRIFLIHGVLLHEWMWIIARLDFEKWLGLFDRLVLLSSFLLLNFVLLRSSNNCLWLLCSHFQVFISKAYFLKNYIIFILILSFFIDQNLLIGKKKKFYEIWSNKKKFVFKIL